MAVWSWYTDALRDYAATVVLLGALMLLVYAGLRALGRNRDTALGWTFVLPWLVGFLAFQLFPFVASLYLAFTDYDVLTPPRWVGLANFARLLDDPKFAASLKFTALYALFSVPLGIAGSLACALLLNRNIKGVGFWRTLYYVPAVIPAVATAVLWRWLLSTDGLVNSILGPVYALLGLDKPRWFLDPETVLPGFVLMSLWGVFGANTVILLAGLKNIPRELYDAAAVDGASGWARFRHVTVPMLSPTLFYVLVTGLIGALQMFTQAFFVEIPRTTPTFLQVYIYQEAFGLRHMGYASAMAWVFLLVILALTLLVFRSSPLWVYYESEVRGEDRAARGAKAPGRYLDLLRPGLRRRLRAGAPAVDDQHVA
ncbi:MAG TPA: sugar ABC transporter permease [Thermaerobacter sp.]